MRLTYRRMALAALLAAARRLYFAFHFRFSTSLHSNSNARVLDCFSSFSDLLYLSFLFESREIPSCRRIRDMQKFLNFVVRDFAFFIQRFQNLFEFLVLSVLNRRSRFHEQVACGVRGYARGCCRRACRRLRRLRRGSRCNRLRFGRQRLIYWYLSRLRFSRLRLALGCFRLRGSRSRLQRCRSWLYNGRRGLRCVFFCHGSILTRRRACREQNRTAHIVSPKMLAFLVGSGIIAI